MDSGKWLNRFSLDLESKYTNSLQTRNNYKSCVSVFLERFKNFELMFDKKKVKLNEFNFTFFCQIIRIVYFQNSA